MTRLIAHRGYSGKYGDNNMQSFEKAIEYSFDMIELDIQMCKSGDIVIYHDVQCDGLVVNDMEIEEIKTHNILTLTDFFKKITPDKVDIFLDIKGEADITCELYKIITEQFSCDIIKHIYISSFNRLIMENIQLHRSTLFPINIGFTTSNSYTSEQCDLLFKEIDFVCLDIHILNRSFIEKIKSMGILVFTYTCSSKTDFDHILTFDIDAIVSNYYIKDLNNK
jgi:glycerophosphoryl diester phosphodiesterase